MSLWLTIPSGDRRKYLKQIIDTSGVPSSHIVIVNTAKNEPTPHVHNLWSDELNIHKWWNMGIDFAVKHGADYVAVLNDDVQLIDDPLNKIVAGMGDAAIGQPDIGSICGYCFVLNTKYGLRADESYTWWYGDNDLYDRAQQYGVARVAVDVRHLHGNELTGANLALLEITKIDKQLYDSRKA